MEFTTVPMVKTRTIVPFPIQVYAKPMSLPVTVVSVSKKSNVVIPSFIVPIIQTKKIVVILVPKNVSFFFSILYTQIYKYKKKKTTKLLKKIHQNIVAVTVHASLQVSSVTVKTIVMIFPTKKIALIIRAMIIVSNAPMVFVFLVIGNVMDKPIAVMHQMSMNLVLL